MPKPQTQQDRDAEAMAINEMTGVRVTAQVQLQGVAFALETTVFSDDELAINGMADRFAKIMGRQKALADLPEKLLALELNVQMLADLEGERDKALADLVDGEVQYMAALQASHAVSGRRAEFRLTDAQKQHRIEQFGDLRKAAVRKQYEDRKSQLEQDMPIIQKQIARLRAVIAGADTQEEPLKDAAE